MGILKDSKGNYRLTGKTTEADVLAAAEGILQSKLERQGTIGNPSDASNFLRMRLGGLLHEEFHIMWLDNRHRILGCQKLFIGTVDGASVYPREVVRAALNVNASAAILAHNHPSGNTKPSQEDIKITKRLKEAGQLMEINVFSPGGLNAMGQMYDTDFATPVIESIERKVYYKSMYGNYLYNSRLATL